MPWIAFVAAFITVAAFAVGPDPDRGASRSIQETGRTGLHAKDRSYVGVWMTADGQVRHELLPDGRYDETRGKWKSSYRGRYWLEGDHIEYADDTGFTADGDFRDGVLHHAGMVFYREPRRPAPR
ncbi:Atu4866 domain-containing protein [Mesorhizobium sp. L-8-3]|uniref:Atu4866 domain-containing protein n=1 Tax=Mesorhizobium sp. L-8-3 TaxID=2744522 RepID=UPI001926637D|nr:Atu4866 domain-containing protein [Mesorhizobium sp. L-8-3]BCH24315.1 hypothetical protein MesoLjLb_41000 [Mesorhizobium sp. L-8-3]